MYGVREFKCLSVKMFASKNGEMDLLRQCFQTEVKFFTQKLIPRLAPMKLATQILPQLNNQKKLKKSIITEAYWNNGP